MVGAGEAADETMTNKHRITLACFLAYFVMSGMLSPIGIISAPMAETLGLSITEVTAGFSWLTFGILIGAVAALFVFDWAGLRQLVILLYGMIAVALLIAGLTGTHVLIWPCLGIVGVCCGIGLAAAALTISRSFDQAQRASMLVITDGSFSVAGIVCSWLAVFAISRQWPWSTAYLFVTLVSVAIVALALVSRYPATDTPRDEGAGLAWPPPVWLCITALFLYTLGQYSLLWWLPAYLTHIFGVPADKAGGVVGQFWSGMFVAQIFVAWWVLKVGARRLVMLAVATTFLGSLPLWHFGDIGVLMVLAFVWGFANLGLLKIVLSYATEQVALPTPRLVSCLLLGATLGTAVSPAVTSQIVERKGLLAVMIFGSGCYLVMAVLVYAAVAISVRRRSKAVIT